MFIASMIKKTYHIRKYENFEHEMKKKMAVKVGEGIFMKFDDENGINKESITPKSDYNRIYPMTEIQKEGGEEEEIKEYRNDNPFQN